MKRTIVRLTLALGVWCCCSSGFAAEVGSTNSVQFELSFETSVFVYDDLVGTRDPFFPESTRRTDLATPEPDPTPIVKLDVSYLQLRGIMGTPPRRIALINGRTFALGDESTFEIGESSMIVKCLEFRQESVVVSVNGQEQRHELFLNDKTLPIKIEEENP